MTLKFQIQSYKSSKTTGSLWFCSKDEATNFNVDIEDNAGFKSFKYNTKLLKNTEADDVNEIPKNAIIAVPLRYLSNFWGSLEIPKQN